MKGKHTTAMTVVYSQELKTCECLKEGENWVIDEIDDDETVQPRHEKRQCNKKKGVAVQLRFPRGIKNCDVCRLPHDPQEHVDIHKNMHTYNVCGVCNKGFSSVSNIMSHMVMEHGAPASHYPWPYRTTYIVNAEEEVAAKVRTHELQMECCILHALGITKINQVIDKKSVTLMMEDLSRLVEVAAAAVEEKHLWQLTTTTKATIYRGLHGLCAGKHNSI